MAQKHTSFVIDPRTERLMRRLAVRLGFPKENRSAVLRVAIESLAKNVGIR